jgi:hypothetical protein
MGAYSDEKREIASDLRLLSQRLIDSGLLLDGAPLDQAAGQCIKSPKDIWAYDITDLSVKIGRIAGAHPSKQYDLTCVINCTVKGSFKASVNNDPCLRLNVGLRYEGIAPHSTPFYQTWHLDREGSAPGKCQALETHPRYHIHFGGEGMTLSADSHRCKQKCHTFGELLLMNQPRLLHPPLDGVLAVDFVLSNAAGANWKALRGDPSYSSMIKRSQDRYWKSFAKTFACHWSTSDPSLWSSIDLCPNLT